MKRPFAVIGFSMLASTLLFYNISFKTAVAVTIAVAAIFCIILPFKKVRKSKTPLFILVSVIVFSLSFILCQYNYYNIVYDSPEILEIRGVVCQTPTHSDYAHTYIVKVENENYKIRYVSEDNRFFTEGTIVSGTVEKGDYTDADYLDSSLASRVYLTFFENEEFYLNDTGERDAFYLVIGDIKNSFTDITSTYIPGENCGIANAMTIGDRSGISQYTLDCFNYAGSSHLLVVSGLHLSLWSLGIMRLVNKSSRLRRFTVPIGVVLLLFYSALTGFSVSVLRAGTMVGAVFLGKIVRRDADSLNSIGVGVTGILLANPFAAYSVSLWFTVLSTVGILVFQKPLENWIYGTYVGKKLDKTAIFRFLVSASTVSLGATICTLPVFVVNFEFLPAAAILSNILMVDAAMVVMVSAVLGAAFHLSGLYPFAEMLYSVSGVLSNFLRYFAEKIGMAEWSGLPMSNNCYKWFIAAMVIGVFLVYLLKKRVPDIQKTVSVILSVSFILISIFTVLHNYNTPTVEISQISEEPVIHINYKGKSVIIGCTDKTSIPWIKTVLNKHGKKSPDLLAVTYQSDMTISHILNYQQTFDFDKTVFCGEGFSMFEDSANNVEELNVGGNLYINSSQWESFVEIEYENKNIIFIYGETEENVFKKEKVYDIILMYSDFSVPENLKSQTIKVASGENVSINL